MSSRPPRKSDIDKEWMPKRRDRAMHIQPERHFIITEGTKTEPYYFERIKCLINEKYHGEKIKLEIEGAGDNTVKLLERAVKFVQGSMNPIKHVWIVYDKDDFPADRFDATATACKARSKGSPTQYHAIWSNECIELWYILHFRFLQAAITRDNYKVIIDDELEKIGKGSYSKIRKDMFDVLRPYLPMAISNAKKLMKNYKKADAPSQCSPGTVVFELVEKLLTYL